MSSIHRERFIKGCEKGLNGASFSCSHNKYFALSLLLIVSPAFSSSTSPNLTTENVIFYSDSRPQLASSNVIIHGDAHNNNRAQDVLAGGDIIIVPEENVAYTEEFDTSFLHGDQGGAANIFIYANNIMPGVKLVDIALNDRRTVKQNINFVVDKSTNTVVPCLNRAILNDLGIKTNLYSGWTTGLNSGSGDEAARCDSLEAIIPDSVVNYNDGIQLISIQVPQAALSSDILKMISPSEWDNGVPSLRLNYDGYVYSTKMRGGRNGGTNTNSYFSLGSTATLGAWRFYSYDTFSKNSDERGWDSNHDRAYAVRDIPSLVSTIQIGDIYTYTPSNVLGVLPLRGVTLGTNTHMMADNQFRYAPVIRGTARTNARVIVRQRGNIIYSTTVTPGSFALDDIYAGQVGADLEITVEEADGSVQVFTVPYTSLPNMLRPNTMRYSVSVGEYRDKNLSDKPVFAAASLERGFDALTLNTSVLGSKDYQAASIGAAWNIGDIGAFSVDTAYARYKNLESRLMDESNEGTAIRFLYAKHFNLTNTGLRILGYQYRSENFLELSEFVSLNNRENDRSSANWSGLYENGQLQRRRNRLEANINQSLGDYGSLYLSANYDRYYGTSETSRSISAGYNTNIKNVTASLNYTHNKYGSSDPDDQLTLSFSIPFNWGDNNYSTVSYSLMRNADNQYSHSINAGGSLAKNKLAYSFNITEDHEANFSESAFLGYNSSYANFTGSVSHSKYSTQYSAGIGGGLLFYEGGVVLSQRLGDTVVIVETPDAGGVGISSNLNITTDYWGRAVLPYATAYRYNNIELDLKNARDNIELMSSAKKIVPTRGATVVAKFDTRVGRRVIVVITPESGVEIPLAASVYAETKRGREEFGMVGHNSEAYLTGLDAAKAQKLTVQWGEGAQEQCRFTLPPLSKEQQKNPDYEWHKKVHVSCR